MLFVISSVFIFIATALLFFIMLLKFVDGDTAYLFAKEINFMGDGDDFYSLFILVLMISFVISVLISWFVFMRGRNK